MAIRWKLPAAALVLILAGGMLTPALKAEEQPHMRAALEHLRAAQKELAEASKDKGGHRARAEQLVKPGNPAGRTGDQVRQSA
jgi:hypothetical protein